MGQRTGLRRQAAVLMGTFVLALIQGHVLVAHRTKMQGGIEHDVSSEMSFKQGRKQIDGKRPGIEFSGAPAPLERLHQRHFSRRFRRRDHFPEGTMSPANIE